ncbi:MAG: aminotransferase class III-fold pyridoxal phosphate-dependent enzyme, partial [Actinobacteria bacterium]|nr:aminotransferase class III-fold pyridoxal phosphate-dependent enzyme [Actinomycetota bacterium]
MSKSRSIDRAKLVRLISDEESRFIASHPKSRQAAAEADESLLGGVPMPWMKRWQGAFPISVTNAQGAKFNDLDGHSYVDFCLGDTGSMTGHAVDEITSAIFAQLNRGSTVMLPSVDSTWVGHELT